MDSGPENELRGTVLLTEEEESFEKPTGEHFYTNLNLNT